MEPQSVVAEMEEDGAIKLVASCQGLEGTQHTVSKVGVWGLCGALWVGGREGGWAEGKQRGALGAQHTVYKVCGVCLKRFGHRGWQGDRFCDILRSWRAVSLWCQR